METLSVRVAALDIRVHNNCSNQDKVEVTFKANDSAWGEREYLKVFFEYTIFKGYIPYDSAMCQYCGRLVGYNGEEQQYYTWGRICFNCGYKNELGAEIRRICKGNLKIICVK